MTEIDALNELASLAAGLNGLAKQLTIPAQRQAAYRLKAAACGAAIMLGGAVVDGQRADDVVGLRIMSTPPTRLHVKVSHMQPAARAEVRRQAPLAAVKAPVGERLDADQIQMLQNLVARKRGQ